MKTETFKTEYSEKLVPLTSEEIQKIKSTRTKTLLGMCIFFVIWYGVLYFIVHDAPDAIFKAFGVIFALFPLVMVGIVLWNAHRDIKLGQKKIITGKIDDKKSRTTTSRSGKNTSSTTYNYFIMSGQEIIVNQKNYSDFQTGDVIEMEILPKSGDVLKIKELRSNTELPGEKKPVFASDRERQKDFLKAPRIVDSAPLSMDEEKLLKTLRNKRIFWTLFFGAIAAFIAFFVLVLVFILVIYPAIEQFNPSRVARIAMYWSIIAAVVGAVLLILFKRISPLQRDLSDGRKNIIKTIITDKERSNVKILNKNWKVTSTSGDFHYVIIDGKYYEVSPAQFLKLHGGDAVKVHVAPYSGTLLKVEGM